jgi:hypothetical protein
MRAPPLHRPVVAMLKPLPATAARAIARSAKRRLLDRVRDQIGAVRR